MLHLQTILENKPNRYAEANSNHSSIYLLQQILLGLCFLTNNHFFSLRSCLSTFLFFVSNKYDNFLSKNKK